MRKLTMGGIPRNGSPWLVTAYWIESGAAIRAVISSTLEAGYILLQVLRYAPFYQVIGAITLSLASHKVRGIAYSG